MTQSVLAACQQDSTHNLGSKKCWNSKPPAKGAEEQLQSWILSPTGPTRCSARSETPRGALHLREKPTPLIYKKKILTLSFFSSIFPIVTRIFPTFQNIWMSDSSSWPCRFLWSTPLYIRCHSYVVIWCDVSGERPLKSLLKAVILP